MTRLKQALAKLLLSVVTGYGLLPILGAPEAHAATPVFTVNIDNPSFRRLVTAVPPLGGGTDPELARISSEATAELGRLFDFSGLFSVMSNAGYQEILRKNPKAQSAGQGLDGIDLNAWRASGVESLTVGEIERDGREFILTLRTVDITMRKLMVGKKYSKVSPAQVKQVIARYADRVLQAYTGRPGIFSSHLLFVGKATKSSYKQVYISDFDGSNAQAITSSQAPHISPAFSHDGRFVTYTSFEDGNPDLFIYEIATGKKRKLSGRKGLNSGSNWAAADTVVAFTGSAEGDADIFAITPDGKRSRAIIRGPGLDVDPSFSPDKKWLAFVSGRFGNPHIFRAELKWDGESDVRVLSDKRLTYAGWWNATPSWSPDSSKIAFAGYDRDIDRFDIFMMNIDGTSMERLTIRSGDNEHPTWSPNGQLLVFESSRQPGRDIKGARQLYVMNRDGSNQRLLKTGLFEAQAPVWGPPQEQQ
jgi:TolB protein